jgi:hypothetical protein
MSLNERFLRKQLRGPTLLIGAQDVTADAGIILLHLR